MHVRAGVFTAVASIMIVGAIFGLQGFPWWTGIGWAGLSLAAAVWLRARSKRSMARVMEAVQAEPTSASAAAAPCGASAMKPFFI